jgi:hypothetical protein
VTRRNLAPARTCVNQWRPKLFSAWADGLPTALYYSADAAAASSNTYGGAAAAPNSPVLLNSFEFALCSLSFAPVPTVDLHVSHEPEAADNKRQSRFHLHHYHISLQLNAAARERLKAPERDSLSLHFIAPRIYLRHLCAAVPPAPGIRVMNSVPNLNCFVHLIVLCNVNRLCQTEANFNLWFATF